MNIHKNIFEASKSFVLINFHHDDDDDDEKKSSRMVDVFI
jgi:hypothetical protein